MELNLRSVLLRRSFGDTNPMEATVIRYSVSDNDNRSSEQMYGYLEARIEALKSRLSQVESENSELRNQIQRSQNRISSAPAKHVATAA